MFKSCLTTIYWGGFLIIMHFSPPPPLFSYILISPNSFIHWYMHTDVWRYTTKNTAGTHSYTYVREFGEIFHFSVCFYVHVYTHIHTSESKYFHVSSFYFCFVSFDVWCDVIILSKYKWKKCCCFERFSESEWKVDYFVDFFPIEWEILKFCVENINKNISNG